MFAAATDTRGAVDTPHHKFFTMFRNFWLRKFATRLCLLSILSLTCADFVRADLFTWTGGGGDNNWSTGANWDLGSAPTANDTLDFAGTTRPSSVNDLADGTTFGDIGFLGSTNTNFSLSGNRITLGGNINVASNGSGTFTHSIANNLTLSGSRQFYAQGDETLVLSGNITSTTATQNFSKGGDGTLILQGTNNAAGNGINQLQVWRGTVQFSSVENLGDNFIQGGLNTNTGTLEYVGSGSTSDLQIRVGDNTAGSGRTGGMNIESNGTGALVFDTASGFALNGAYGNATAARTLTLGGSNTADNRVVQKIQNNNTAGGGIVNLVKDGAGTWVLGNDDGTGSGNTYTGTTTINEGILRLSDEDKLYNNNQTDWNSTNVTVASGATLAFNMTNTGSNWSKQNIANALTGIGTGFQSGSSFGLHINSGGDITLNNSDTPKFNEVVAGTGFRKTGEGTFKVSQNMIFSGTLNVDAGTLQLGTGFSNGMIGSSGSATVLDSDVVVSSGAALKFFKSNGRHTLSGAISGGGTIEMASSDSGVSSDVLHITGDGSGFTGTTNIVNGRLEIGDNATSGSLGGDVSLASGSRITFQRADAYTFSGDISGDASLIQEGNNAGEANFSGEQLILSGNNSYTGGTTINSETEIVAASNSALGTGTVTLAGQDAGLILNNGVSLANNIEVSNNDGRNHIELSSGGGSATLSGDIAVDNNDVFNFHFRTNGGDLTVAGNIGDGSGNGFFYKNLAGSLILTGDTTLTGGVRVDGGLSSILQIGDGGTTGSITSDIDNRGVVEFNRSDAVTYNGVISTGSASGGAVYQSGSGITTFTGNNSYKGETQVNAGTLVINGDQSAATGNVVVASGATLAGIGIIGGATTISGTHGPGNSPGIQTFNSDLSYEAGAVIDWELVSNTSDSSGTRGTDFDGIDVGGALSFNGATTLNFDFGGSVNFADAFWTTDGASETWSIFTGASSVNSIGNLSFNVNGATAPGTFTLSDNGSDVFLNYSFSAVPEPTTFLMFGLGLGCLGFGRRRKPIKNETRKA